MAGDDDFEPHKRRYPPEWAKVTVTFTDGQVQEFVIDAGPRINNYLVRQTATTGFLTLRTGATSRNIPAERIFDWTIEPAEKPQREKPKPVETEPAKVLELKKPRKRRSVQEGFKSIWSKS